MSERVEIIDISGEDITSSMASAMLDGFFKPTRRLKKQFITNGGDDLERLTTVSIPKRMFFDEKGQALPAEQQLEAFSNLLRPRSFRFLIKNINPVIFSDLLLRYINAFAEEHRLDAIRKIFKKRHVREYLNRSDVSTDFLIEFFQKAERIFPNIDDREQLFDEIHAIRAFQQMTHKQNITGDIISVVPSYIKFLSTLERKTAARHYYELLEPEGFAKPVTGALHDSGFASAIVRASLEDMYDRVFDHHPDFIKSLMTLRIVKKLVLDEKSNRDDYIKPRSNMETFLDNLFSTFIDIKDDIKRDTAYKTALGSKLMTRMMDKNVLSFTAAVGKYIARLDNAESQINALDELLENKSFVAKLGLMPERIFPVLMSEIMPHSYDPAQTLLWFSDRLMTTKRGVRQYASRFIAFALNYGLSLVEDMQGCDTAETVKADMGIYTAKLNDDVMDGSETHLVMHVTSQGVFTSVANKKDGQYIVHDLDDVFTAGGKAINVGAMKDSKVLMELMTEALRHFEKSEEETSALSAKKDFKLSKKAVCPYKAEREIKHIVLKQALMMVVSHGVYKGERAALERVSILHKNYT